MRKRLGLAFATGLIAVLLLFASFSQRTAGATPGTWPYSTFTAAIGSFTTSLAVAVFNVTGQEAHSGTENHSGIVAFGGVVTSTANVQVEAASLSVSSAITSRLPMTFLGAYESSNTFPVGAAEGSMAYAIANHTMYTATGTVVQIGNWKNMY